MTFVVWGIILGVKKDADVENDICKRMSQRLGIVIVGFSVNRVVFRKICILRGENYSCNVVYRN